MSRRASWLLLAVGLAVYLLLYAYSLKGPQLDFFIYRTGAKFALEGKTPYDTDRMREEVEDWIPRTPESDFADNCGFFLPPQAIAMFAPLAAIERQTAEVEWFLILTACALATGTLAWTFGRDPKYGDQGWAIVIVVVLLNPITQPSLVVGQTTLLLVGSIALGQLCFERRLPVLGCFLWALPFVKPHLAILFLGVAWALGGWKRAAGIVAFVVGLNLLGGLILRRDPGGAVLLFREYLGYLGSAHKAVVYNLVERNYQITSWNRLLYVLGGPAINLKVPMTLAGYAVWVALVSVRLRRRVFDSPSFLLATAAVGTLFFAQVLAYEMLLLALLAPLILQLFDAGKKNDTAAIIGLLIFLLIPLNVMDTVANGMGLSDESWLRLALLSHKCFGMALLAGYLVVRARVLTSVGTVRKYAQTQVVEVDR